MAFARRWAMFLLLAAGAPAFGAAPFEALERETAKLVNADRAKHKLPPLSYRADLAAVARAHGVDMKANGFFDHTSKRTGKVADRLARARIAVRAAGENLARARTIQRAELNLMNSKPHRKNILSKDFTHIGIGIVKGDGGVLFVTQVFIRAVPVYDTKALPAQIIEAINKARLKKGLRRLVTEPRLMRVAHEHCQRANRLGRFDEMWLEDRVARTGGRWRIRQCAYFLTDKLAEVVDSPIALSRLHGQIGVGVVQSSPHSKTAAALWVTLICARK